jgi:tripartite-type tricarboxylate transporter receptor subunit TctC
VDNRLGASGNIASELAAKAPADGHTLFIAGAGSLAINVSLFSKLRYDPVRDFAPIILVAAAPFIVAVHPAVPASSINELIALAKSRPGELSYGTPGSGSTSHLATELFATTAGVRFLHIPYKGSVLATTDLIGGQIQLSFASTPGSMPYVKSGQLKALGVTSVKRLNRLPALPTVSEILPSYEATVWYGFVAPAGTPREVVERLNAEIASIIQDPLHQERLLANDYEPTTTSPEQFGAFIKSEIVKWAQAVKISGARAD